MTLFDYDARPVTPQVMQDLEGSIEAELTRLARRAEAAEVEVATQHGIGVPFQEIVRQAEEHHADLIIMGTHGRTGLRHALLGSVAEKVVRKAPCPVLTVRHPEHEFVHP